MTYSFLYPNPKNIVAISFIEQIIHHLLKLNQHPNGRLLLKCSPFWMVFHSLDTPTRALCEISSNKYLPESSALTETQINRFDKLSFTKRRRERSLGKLVTLMENEQREQIAAETQYIFEDIFNIDSSNVVFEFYPNARRGLQNKDLLRCMKVLSGTKQHSARISLYKSLLNSRLLVLMDPETPGIPLPIEKLIHFDVYACFTDYSSARCFDPRVGELKEDYAYNIFKNLWNLNLGSLKLNPKGDIGGELYRSEIESLIQAIKSKSV